MLLPALFVLGAAPVAPISPEGPGAPSAQVAPPDVELLRLAPDDALMVARVARLDTLLARRGSSQWLQLITDPAWDGVLAGLRDAAPGDDAASAERAEAVAADVLHALGGARAAVAMVVAPGGPDDSPVIAFAALGGDTLAEPLGSLLRGQGEPMREGALELRAADGGVAEAYLRRGDLHLVVDAEDAETALRFGREALARLDAGAPLGGALARFRADADAEFGVDLAPLWRSMLAGQILPAEAAPFFELLASVEWIHGRFVVGEGEVLDLAVEAPISDAGLGAKLMGAFQPCDPTLLGLAPSLAISASAGKADFAALADVVLAEIAANAPERRKAIDAALAALRETSGIDVLGTLVGGLTGHYLSFAMPVRMAAAAEATPVDERLEALDLSCTAFGIRDPEPYIAAIETALDALAGAGVEVGTTTFGGAEIWSTDATGQTLAIAVHPEYVCLAMDQDALAAFLSRVNGDEDAPASFLARPEHAAAARELSGTYVSLASTRSTVAFVGNVLEIVGLTFVQRFDPADGDLARFGRALDAAGRLTARLGLRYFKGTLRGRLVVREGRILSQTEAR